MDEGLASRPAASLWMPLPDFAPPPAGVAEALARLWRHVDDRLSPLATACRACGRCCDFPRAGHMLCGAKV
jgi:hypothetical protein